MRDRLSTTFWRLATGSAVETESRDPLDVVRHLLAAMDGLEGHRPGTQVAADALHFLMRLEHEPHYASPEQTRGGEKDSRALVYSIGVLLFERLTGHHPFVESLSPLECAVARDMSMRRGPNNLCSLPGQLRDVLRCAMSPFPEDRYESLRELRDALERVVMTPRIAKGTNPPRTMTQPDTRVAPPPAAARSMTQAATRVAPRPTAPPPRRATRTMVTPPPSREGTATGSIVVARPLSASERTVTLPAGTYPSSNSALSEIERAETMLAPARPRRRSTPPPCPGSKEREAREASRSDLRPPTHLFTPTPAPLPEQPVLTRLTRPTRPTRLTRLATGSAPSRIPAAETSADLVARALRAPATPHRFLKPAIVTASIATVSLVATLAIMSVRSSKSEASTPPPAPAEPTLVAVPLPAAELVIEPAPPPAPAVFDPTTLADTVLTHVRSCIPAARLAHSRELGISLRFPADTGVVDKVYFGPDLDLTSDERTCIRTALAGLTAGAAPDKSIAVPYSLWVTHSGGTARAHFKHDEPDAHAHEQ